MATLLVGKTGFEPVSFESESKILNHYTISQFVPPSRTDRDPSVSKTLMLNLHTLEEFVTEIGLEPISESSKLPCPALDDSAIFVIQPGFGPGLREPKSLVLPLHYWTI